LEGQPLFTFKKEADKAKKSIRDYKPRDGECWKDVYNRAQNFIDEVVGRSVLTPLNAKTKKGAEEGKQM